MNGQIRWRTEEPTSHAVVVGEVTEMLAAKIEGFGYQRGVGDLDSSEDSGWKICHDIET